MHPWVISTIILLTSCSAADNFSIQKDSGSLQADAKNVDTLHNDSFKRTDGNLFKITCQEGEHPLTSTLVLKTAHIEFRACTFQGSGHTIGFRLMSVVVKDASPLLPENAKGKELIIPESKIVLYKYPDPRKLPEGKQLIYDQNHHNACESFYLNFPELDLSYGVSTPPLAGCGPVLENAPERKITPDDPLGQGDTADLLFRIKYPHQPWGETEELKGAKHYLFVK